MTHSSRSKPPTAYEQAPRQRQTCVDCGVEAPQTETNFTLISQRHGWRLTRTQTASGRHVMEWRCPHCYASYRVKRK